MTKPQYTPMMIKNIKKVAKYGKCHGIKSCSWCNVCRHPKAVKGAKKKDIAQMIISDWAIENILLK